MDGVRFDGMARASAISLSRRAALSALLAAAIAGGRIRRSTRAADPGCCLCQSNEECQPAADAAECTELCGGESDAATFSAETTCDETAGTCVDAQSSQTVTTGAENSAPAVTDYVAGFGALSSALAQQGMQSIGGISLYRDPAALGSYLRLTPDAQAAFNDAWSSSMTARAATLDPEATPPIETSGDVTFAHHMFENEESAKNAKSAILGMFEATGAVDRSGDAKSVLKGTNLYELRYTASGLDIDTWSGVRRDGQSLIQFSNSRFDNPLTVDEALFPAVTYLDALESGQTPTPISAPFVLPPGTDQLSIQMPRYDGVDIPQFRDTEEMTSERTQELGDAVTAVATIYGVPVGETNFTFREIMSRCPNLDATQVTWDELLQTIQGPDFANNFQIDKLPNVPFDPELAAALLDEAGFPYPTIAFTNDYDDGVAGGNEMWLRKGATIVRVSLFDDGSRLPAGTTVADWLLDPRRADYLEALQTVIGETPFLGGEWTPADAQRFNFDETAYDAILAVLAK